MNKLNLMKIKMNQLNLMKIKSNKKKKIGIDIDEVLAEFMPELNNFYNSLHRTKFKFEDYKSYDLEKIWGGDRETSVMIVKDFYKSAYFYKIKPAFYSQKALEILSKDNELIAITFRPTYLQEATEYWVKKFFPEKIKKVICTNQYVLSPLKISKLDICLKEGIEVIIEDNLQVAVECAGKGIKSFLLDKPWNQNGSNKISNLIRVKNWKSLLDILEKCK